MKAFLSENLKGGAPQNFIIERLDSTNFLVDSAIVVMHKNTEASPNYKQGINYAKRPAKQRLVWITATFETQGKAQKQTFYLNRECDQVIAVNP